MRASSLTENEQQDLATFIDETNQRLEDETMENANRAFNLGCMVGLLPAGLVVLLSYFLTKGSWIPVGITAVLMFIALMLFTNLAAYTARNRTMERVYEEKIAPTIDVKLSEYQVEEDEFSQIADDALPAGAMLRNYLTIKPTKFESDDEIDVMDKD
jgi:hypothetical protein